MPEPERIDLPAGYGDFAPFTLENAPDWDDFERALEHSRNYWLSVTDEHGPHSVPVWGVWFDGTFVFSTDRETRKGRALVHDQRCAVHLESGDDVLIVEGRAEPLPLTAIDRFITAYERKYRIRLDPADPAQLLVRVIPLVAFTWLERDFARTATRWRF